MIKVAISGADHPDAGELIRILVNHPDVEITALVAPGMEGKQVQQVHHGLLGESPLCFTSSLKQGMVDVLFVADRSITRSDLARLHKAFPDLKIIILHDLVSTEHSEEFPDLTPVFALPEINRKALVRGAKTALIPTPISSLALVPLYPLATHMLLSDDIAFFISAPEDLVDEGLLEKARKEIAEELRKAQLSFNGSISFELEAPQSKRGIEIKTKIPTPLNIEHILQTYEIYDDHNFSYAVTTPVRLDDVKGTEKIITSLSLSKDGILSLHAVADGRLRGSAGEAVHVMNLMFGLHEKTGLYLKPYAY